MTTTSNATPMFWDITPVFSETDPYHWTNFEEARLLGIQVPIDPNDQDAVIRYFKNPDSVPQTSTGSTDILTFNRSLVYKERQRNGQVKLLYVVRTRDDGFFCQVSTKPEAGLLRLGCCIAMLQTDPVADAVSMSDVNSVQACFIDVIANRVRWTTNLGPEELGEVLPQFGQFSYGTDAALEFNWSGTEDALKKQGIDYLVDTINGPPNALSYMEPFFEGRAITRDPKDRLVVSSATTGRSAVKGFADGMIEYWGKCMMVVELKRADPQTTSSFSKTEVEQALAQCLALTKETDRPVFGLLTDLQTRWMIIWNTIVRPGGLRYERAIEGKIGQHRLMLRKVEALPIIRGLLLYCRSYMRALVAPSRIEWWGESHRPGDDESANDDPRDAEYQRRRAEFFRCFDITSGSSNTGGSTQSSPNDHATRGAHYEYELVHDPYANLQDTIEYHQEPGKPPIVDLKREYDQYLHDHNFKPVKYEELDEQGQEQWHRLEKDWAGKSLQDALMQFLNDVQEEEKEINERATESTRLANERVQALYHA